MSIALLNTPYKSKYFMRFQKLLVAIDDSPLCPAVFAAALELAQSNKASIRLLCSINPDIVSESAVPTALDPNLPLGLGNSNDFQVYETQQVLIDQQVGEAQALLKRYMDKALSYSVATESDYKLGEPGHQLCEAAKDWGADLVVVGRRGLTGLREALQGSVSNYVVHHAPCSVLVIQEVEPELPPEAITD